VLAITALFVLGGYALKAQCLDAWDGRQYARLCYNDIQPLYSARGIDRGTFPYVEGELVDGELVGGAIEYPVLTGVFMWASGKLASDPNEYLRVSAFLLAPLGILIAYVLVRMRGWRALMWGASPAIVLYSFHNWDLLVVACAVVGFFLYARGYHTAAAIAFGIGGGFKWYPAFFLVPLVLERLTARDRRGAASCAAAGGITLLVINLPFMAANFDAWWVSYEFHQLRIADFNSIWHWWPGGLDAEELNFLTGILIGGAFLAALLVGWRRGRQTGVFPFVQVCGAMLAAFLLFNKVHSPQYALWLLPFFALIGAGWRPWVLWGAYSIADLAVYVGIFRWFYDFVYRHVDVTAAKRVLIAGVWTRAALLAILFVYFLTSREVTKPEEDKVLSHPLAKVAPETA
jgi:uncharacterized membrane protein